MKKKIYLYVYRMKNAYLLKSSFLTSVSSLVSLFINFCILYKYLCYSHVQFSEKRIQHVTWCAFIGVIFTLQISYLAQVYFQIAIGLCCRHIQFSLLSFSCYILFTYLNAIVFVCSSKPFSVYSVFINVYQHLLVWCVGVVIAFKFCNTLFQLDWYSCFVYFINVTGNSCLPDK